MCVLADISLASTNCYWRVKSPSRKINFDGNITVKAISELNTNDNKNVILTITSKDNRIDYPELVAARSGIRFFDAKLDEKSNRLAVIYDGGEPLIYDYYELQNDKWVLLKRTFLVEYDLFFNHIVQKLK